MVKIAKLARSAKTILDCCIFVNIRYHKNRCF
jgi:hypothetical protein